MKNVILMCIKLYQNTAFLRKPFIRTVLGNERTCRFNPICSDYTYNVVKEYGAIKGLWLGIKRISKCQPYTRNY
ncbi:MAG: membrane protein insertion efficiency factor YidD [bacterium]